MMRGGGRRSVKYEEVITLAASGRTYFETKVRNDASNRSRVAARGLEQRKGGVVAAVAGVEVVYGSWKWRTVNSVKHRLQPRVSARGRA